MKRLFLAFTILSMFMSTSLSATHIKGGFITATCADDPNTSTIEYQVDGILLRDITGITAPQSMLVAISTGSTVNLQSVGVALIPYGNGVLEIHYYSGTAALPSNSIVTMSFDNCCRTPSIINIPNSPAIHLRTVVNTNAGCNSTPNFITFPAASWPDQTPWTMAATAYDLDGDSLYYNLSVPMSDAVTPIAGYTLPPSLPGGEPTLDSLTGMFTYTANGQGLYSIVYQVRAYDSTGVMTGMVSWDGVFAVVLPPSGNLVSVTPPSNVVNGTYTFTSGNLDTLLVSATSDSTLTASVYYPPYVDSNEVFSAVDVHKTGTTADVRFNWNPANYDGSEFPVVIRFESAEFAYDYQFMAKSKNTIGLNEELLEWTIYPNPSTGEVIIDSDVEIESIQVMDVNGRVVATETLNTASNQHRLNLEVVSGIYFIQMFTLDGEMHTQSLIVK